MSAVRRASVALAVGLAIACGDSGPQGPGAFDVTLQAQGPLAGAVVADVTGQGIGAIQGVGDTRVFSTVIDATTGLSRVIVVSASGNVAFRIQVDQLELGPPSVVAIDAAGTDNLPRGPAGLTFQITH